MLRKIMALAALSTMMTAAPAMAAQYMVSYTTSTNNTFSGVFTTTDVADANGFFTVTGLTGSRNGVSASLLPVGSFGSNDNLFKPTAGYLSVQGIAFTAGGVILNPYLSQTSGLREFGGGNVSITNFTVGAVAAPTAAVPEPATWLTMILGMGAIGFAMRRRQNVRTAVTFA